MILYKVILCVCVCVGVGGLIYIYIYLLQGLNTGNVYVSLFQFQDAYESQPV
jgi:hypothetical protein